MKKIILFVLTVLLFQYCSKDPSARFEAGELKVNNLNNPEGTNKNPVFSWIATSSEKGAGQTAYQIILDTDEANLRSENNCLWNSGKILSDESFNIKYSGEDLKPSVKYYWKVRIWNNNDIQSSWSRTACFITGLFNREDWNNARWIGYEEIPDSLLLVPGIHRGTGIKGDIARKRTVIPYFRTEVVLDKKIDEAYAFISGLGHYELYINGKRIGDRFLSPGWTDYDKTCYYNTYDVTDVLEKGNNSFGAITGNGFYNINRERYYKLVIAYGAPKIKMMVRIRYTDGTGEIVITDQSWKTSPSPVTFSSIFGGEDYDAGLEQPGWDRPGFDDSKWGNALLVREPTGELKPETDHPVRIMETFEPVSISNPAQGIYI